MYLEFLHRTHVFSATFELREPPVKTQRKQSPSGLASLLQLHLPGHSSPFSISSKAEPAQVTCGMQRITPSFS